MRRGNSPDLLLIYPYRSYASHFLVFPTPNKSSSAVAIIVVVISRSAESPEYQRRELAIEGSSPSHPPSRPIRVAAVAAAVYRPQRSQRAGSETQAESSSYSSAPPLLPPVPSPDISKTSAWAVVDIRPRLQNIVASGPHCIARTI